MRLDLTVAVPLLDRYVLNEMDYQELVEGTLCCMLAAKRRSYA